ITWVWQGRVAQVIAALHDRQAELGLPAPDEPDSSPRAVVARTLTYLGNQQDKMHYDAYRRQGLPGTSSLMESGGEQGGRRGEGDGEVLVGSGRRSAAAAPGGPLERRRAARGLLAAPRSGCDRATSQPPRGVTANYVVRPRSARLVVAAY